MGIRRRLVALTSAALALSSGCAYHAGTAAAESFHSWVRDHPIRGARIVDTVGRDKYAFAGELTAFARLTTTPSDRSIDAAMKDLCAYDGVTKVPTKYWLQVERISVQLVCTDAGRAALIRFYDALADLTTFDHVFLDPTGIQAEAPDAMVPQVAGQVFAAADATGTLAEGASYTFSGKHVKVTTKPGVDVGPELTATSAILPVVGEHVSAVKVTDGLVVTETTGTVAQARTWQQAVTTASGTTLLVTPARVVSDVALTPPERTVVEDLSDDARVSSVSTFPGHWSIDLTDTSTAPSLLPALAAKPAARQLGELTVERVMGFRSCYVVARLPASGAVDPAATTLLALCGREDMPTVDGRFGHLYVRMTGDDLRAVLVAAHTMPAGTDVAIQSEGTQTSGNYSFTTGATLTFDQSFASDNALQRIWARLGPYQG